MAPCSASTCVSSKGTSWAKRSRQWPDDQVTIDPLERWGRIKAESGKSLLYQRLGITRQRLSKPKRVDYEYERAGTGSIFMFTEPLAGWRSVSARPKRTKTDWAYEVGELIRTRYKNATKVTLVCDNLNTHTIGAFYTVYSPDLARSIVRKIQFCLTPKHGSWLNVAENELSSMTRQCLAGKRFESIEALREETHAWAAATNNRKRGVDWQFKVDEARRKLSSLYPNIES